MPFGVLTGLSDAHRRGNHGVDGWITGTVSGVLFGVFMSVIAGRQQAAREQRTAVFTAGLSAPDRALAVRASRRGPIPDDPAICAAAARLTRDRLEQSIRQRGRNLAGLAVFAVLELVEVVTSSRWYWLAVLMFAASFVAQLRQPGTLHRRLSQLDAT